MPYSGEITFIEFYVPGDSAKAQAREADAHNLKLLEQIPVTETERKALKGIVRHCES